MNPPMSAPTLSDAAANFGKRWLSINLDEGSQYSAKAIGNLLGRALTDAFEAGRAIEAKVRTLRAGQPVAWIQPWALDLFRDDKNAYSQPVVPERRSPWEVPLYLGGAGQSEPVAAEGRYTQGYNAAMNIMMDRLNTALAERTDAMCALSDLRAALASIPTDAQDPAKWPMARGYEINWDTKTGATLSSVSVPTDGTKDIDHE